VKSGGQVGISSRGLGSVVNESNGTSIVQEDFTLICFDIVADPSTPGAFMNPQKIRESKEMKV
ncbi:MAG TPA: primosomal protein, partial [Balneola sp.]|nr:primosomal protein [Balneola sp.]